MLRSGAVKATLLLGLAVAATVASAQEPGSWFKFWSWLNSLNSADAAKHAVFLAQQMSPDAQRRRPAAEKAAKEMDTLNQAGGGFTLYKTVQMTETEMRAVLKGQDGHSWAETVLRLGPEPGYIISIQLYLVSDPVKLEPISTLSVPELWSPGQGEVFTHFPRHTTLRWNSVPFAASYQVQWDYQYGTTWASEDRREKWPSFETTETSYTFDFVGAQPGRWRVWALDIDGNPGPKSEWLEFRYTN
ncbi:MAG TPA: hypothetical protein VHA33_28395 [Candidatus Angelobacter sp.]|nr:hypothetical protein [Candidatus Angelobacter sp.]